MSVDKTKVLAIIPARGGSRGIPGKNLKKLAGKPLLVYSIEQAKAVPAIDRVVVSSDDDAVLEVAQTHGAQAIKRPSEFSGDTAKMDGAILHALTVLAEEGYRPDLVVLLQPTSPLRRVQTIARAIHEFSASGERFDSLMPLAETSSKVGTIAEKQFRPQYAAGAQRQELPVLYYDCGTVYLFKPTLLATGKFFGERIYAFPVSWPESLDIDTRSDFELAEYFLMKK